MGNLLSTVPTGEVGAEEVKSESGEMSNTNVSSDDSKHDTETDNSSVDESRARAKEEEMEEFKKQLSVKREQRREILARHKAEKEELERSLQTEKVAKLELCEKNKLLRELLTRNNIEIPDSLMTNSNSSEVIEALEKMKEELIEIKLNNRSLRKDLAETNNALQNANSDIADLNFQNTESIKQIRALKEVVSVSKTMIGLREQQLNDLKNKLNEIERTLGDRETNLLSHDLRQEYARQLRNIRTLRGLYEERARLAEVTRQGLVRELDEHKILYQAEAKRCKDLKEKVDELESRTDSLIEKIENKNSQISSCQQEKNVLKAEMTVVNKLFSQVLLGNKTKQDLDTLVHRLEENHGILTQMAERENGSEVSSALPKLLLELVSQIDERNDNTSQENLDNNEQEAPIIKDSEIQKSNTTVADIVENLPKVWKVLIELLSHQNTSEAESLEKVTTCYKSVETASGPVLVPSVSQTYIRLKDLIVEKLGLIKEVNHMKQLNTHLETRLEEQERRLCLVTSELSKTWHVVGRLRRHHHQLHTHEKILKYELQQKRKLLNELKEELEYCREKCDQAREKNTQSEKDWRKLRAEFNSRKVKTGSPSFNNSGESGYSDERQSDESSESNDESEYVAEPLVRCKKKVKKSFEPILDSSADFNLAAEREDPVSDMIDVADLPLDTQDSEENHSLEPENGQSKPLAKIDDKISEETEDEAADITCDDCPDEGSGTLNLQSSDTLTSIAADVHGVDNTISDESSSGGVVIDPAEILRNIQLQNERLALKDERLKRLESNTAAVLEKTQTTVVISEQISSSLDSLINRPSASSSQNNVKDDASNKNDSATSHLEKEIVSDDNTLDNITSIALETNTELTEVKSTDSEESSLEINNEHFNQALQNNNQPNETEISDEGTNSHQVDCENNLLSINDACDDTEKAEHGIIDLQTASNNNEDFDEDDNSSLEKEESGPSTSGDIDHEARFAARDLRLKRLEEQTKSLVSKVNKTTSKGVKIHYKLEELHNIYGSETSRAGTPSEEIEDQTNENESPEE